MSWASKFERVQVAREEGGDHESLLVELGAMGSNLQNQFSSLWGNLGLAPEKKHDQDVESGRATVPTPGAAAGGGVFGGLANAFHTAETEQPVLGMNYIQRFRAFISLMLLAILFFGIAFTVGLPIVVLRPAKFAVSFTTGSLLIMLAFVVLKGPWTHVKSMCQRDVAPFSVLYVLSMGGTLWASFVARSYLLVIFMSGTQLLALGYYTMSGIPGGARGFSVFVAAIKKAITTICYPFCLACKTMIRALTGL